MQAYDCHLHYVGLKGREKKIERIEITNESGTFKISQINYGRVAASHLGVCWPNQDFTNAQKCEKTHA